MLLRRLRDQRQAAIFNRDGLLLQTQEKRVTKYKSDVRITYDPRPDFEILW